MKETKIELSPSYLQGLRGFNPPYWFFPIPTEDTSTYSSSPGRTRNDTEFNEKCQIESPQSVRFEM